MIPITISEINQSYPDLDIGNDIIKMICLVSKNKSDAYNKILNHKECLKPEVIINNKFKLLSKISNGSFGTVWRALSLENNNILALKLSRSSLKSEADILIYCNNITGVNKVIGPMGFDFQLNWYYLPLELLSMSLRQCCKIHKVIPIENIKGFGTKLISIFSNIHKKGIIYRDLSPSNIMLDMNNLVTLVDFGLSLNTIIMMLIPILEPIIILQVPL